MGKTDPRQKKLMSRQMHGVQNVEHVMSDINMHKKTNKHKTAANKEIFGI